MTNTQRIGGRYSLAYVHMKSLFDNTNKSIFVNFEILAIKVAEL